MTRKKQEKVWYRIVATFNSDNWKKYCELTETVHMSYNRIMARVNRYYSVGYDDYGKAEAVELEILTKDQIKEWVDYNDEN
jgi:hypothetical protein